jgi:hypothetical protein
MTRNDLRASRLARWVPFAWAPTLAIVVAALGGDLLASRARPPLAFTGAVQAEPLPAIQLHLPEPPCPRAEPARPRLLVQSPPIVIKVTLPAK